jgi:hypothetical protein
MPLGLRYGQREVNDRRVDRERSSNHPEAPRQGVEAGVDDDLPAEITRQVNGSRRQAEKVEARLRTEVADGMHAGTRLKTLGELVDLWIEWRAASDKPISPDTVEDYRSLIAKKINLPRDAAVQ